jgi:hypothetical protein
MEHVCVLGSKIELIVGDAALDGVESRPDSGMARRPGSLQVLTTVPAGVFRTGGS